MSEEIEIEMLVHCPIIGDLYPYEKCRKCLKYREQYKISEFGEGAQLVTMWCDYE